VKFEIGHVVFIDIVGYSKLLITEQSELLQKLKEIVRGTEQFRLVEAQGKLVRLPTGDGGALVFRNNLEAPVPCALEIGKELKKQPELRCSENRLVCTFDSFISSALTPATGTCALFTR